MCSKTNVKDFRAACAWKQMCVYCCRAASTKRVNGTQVYTHLNPLCQRRHHHIRTCILYIVVFRICTRSPSRLMRQPRILLYQYGIGIADICAGSQVELLVQRGLPSSGTPYIAYQLNNRKEHATNHGECVCVCVWVYIRVFEYVCHVRASG